jgi:hypothetical protein
MQTETNSPEIVRLRAYQIWEAEGRPHGRDQAHWYQAEREVGAKPAAVTAPARATPGAKTRRRTSANGSHGGRKRKADEARL